MWRTRKTQETTALPDPGAQPLGTEAPGPAVGFGGGELGWPDSGAAARQAAPAAAVTPAQPEEIIVRVRRHGRHLALPVLLLWLIAGFGGFYIGTLPEPWMNVAAAGGALALIAFGVIGPLLGWLARRTVVTTRRVIMHRGFFVRHRSEVSLARVREVRSKQNPVQRLWGSGDIDLLVGSESVRLTDVPTVNSIHAAIQELSELSYDEQLRATSFGL